MDWSRRGYLVRGLISLYTRLRSESEKIGSISDKCDNLVFNKSVLAQNRVIEQSCHRGLKVAAATLPKRVEGPFGGASKGPEICQMSTRFRITRRVQAISYHKRYFPEER